MAKTDVLESVKQGRELSEFRVGLRGLTPIMFDPYAGSNKVKLPIEKKLYFLPDGKTLCIPAANIHSFLSAELTMSAPRMFEGKGWQSVAKACLSYVSISPDLIPIERGGKPVQLGVFKNGLDETSGVFVHYANAKMKKGNLVIPNPKERPVLPLPWGVEFKVTLFRNAEVDENKLRSLFEKGGLAIGLGTFRGVFGKFEIVEWGEWKE